MTEFHYLEKHVRCPEGDEEAIVYLERSETLDGETVEVFSCRLLDGRPGCRRHCLRP